MSAKKLKKRPYKRVFPEKMTEETAHYSAILIENLEDKFKFVTEAVAGFQESFPRQMTEMESRLGQRVDDTQKALKMTREVLEGKIVDTQKSLEMTRKVLEERIDKVETTLDAKIDRVGAALEAKIDKVEAVLSDKIDCIGEVITRHEEEISSLKKTG